MSDLNEFGEYLKVARNRKGLSLRAVEAQIDISNAYLSQLEQGKVKHPSPVTLHQLCELYNLSYSEVMRMVGYPVPGDDEDKESQSNLAARLGSISSEEEEELLDYLNYLRSKRKGDGT